MNDQTKEPDSKSVEHINPDERPATPKEDGTKTGMHRPGSDPQKQIPATEGGET